VAEVLAVCRAECNGGPEAEFVDRRAGDPDSLVASSVSAASALGWKPSRSLYDCVTTALAWHRGSSSQLQGETS